MAPPRQGGARPPTAEIRPGRTGRELHELACELFADAGYQTQLHKQPGEVLEDGFFHGLGHGVGLEVHEAPSLGRARHDAGRRRRRHGRAGPLPSGYGGLRLEDLVLVTEDGHEVLTDYPYDLTP